MQWKHYLRNVVKRYRVVVEGWPAAFPFRNLSENSSSLGDLEDLLQKWRDGTIFWQGLTNEEFTALMSKHDQAIDDGEITAPDPRRRCSDLGKKRSRSKQDKDNHQSRKSRKKKISPETVHSDSEQSNRDRNADESPENGAQFNANDANNVDPNTNETNNTNHTNSDLTTGESSATLNNDIVDSF
jgi:hypothetical protein